MSGPKTVLEVREFYKPRKQADVVRVRRFDELEGTAARSAYSTAVVKARPMLGTELTLMTVNGGEITEVIDRIVIELVSFKTLDGRCWDHRVVGTKDDDKFEAGMRTVLETAVERSEPEQAPEKNESPAAHGAPAETKVR